MSLIILSAPSRRKKDNAMKHPERINVEVKKSTHYGLTPQDKILTAVGCSIVLLVFAAVYFTTGK